MSQQSITCPVCNNHLDFPATGWSGKGECPFCGCKFRLRYDPEVLLTSLNPELPRPAVKLTYAPAPIPCPDCLNELEAPMQVWNGKVRCQFCACKFRLHCKPEIVELPQPVLPAPAASPVLLPPQASPSPKPHPFTKSTPAIKLAKPIPTAQTAAPAAANQPAAKTQATAGRLQSGARQTPASDWATEELQPAKTPYQEIAYTSTLSIPNAPADSLPPNLEPTPKVEEFVPIDPRLVRSRTQLNLLLQINGQKRSPRSDPEDLNFSM
jgi:hypothetical protein